MIYKYYQKREAGARREEESTMDVNKTVQRSNGKVLRIASHALVKVPQSVFQLVGLVELDLSSNSISEIPGSIRSLCGLQILKHVCSHWWVTAEMW